MGRCIYTGVDFAESDGEHVLQNSLGARWTSREISSNGVQKLFGAGIDIAIEQGLKEMRNALGTKGGRGNQSSPLKNVPGLSGAKYHLPPGSAPVLSEPIVEIRPLPDGTFEVEAKMASRNQLGWVIAKIKEQQPDAILSIDVLKEQLAEKSDYLDDKLMLSGSIGGIDFFRGTLKSAFNLLGASSIEIALLPEFSALRQFVLHGEGDTKNFVRWLRVSEKIAAPRIGDFDQFLSVYSRNGGVEGFVQFFGAVRFVLRLSENYHGPDFCYTYVVDPLREGEPSELRHPEFDMDAMPFFINGAETPDDEARACLVSCLADFLAMCSARQSEQHISQMVNSVFLPHEGEPLTEELWDEFNEKLLKFLAHRLGLPRQ